MARKPHEPLRPKGVAYSPRPIRDERRGTETYQRVPFEGPLTPRLRQDGLTHAIGFTAHIGGKWEELD